jgi:hypothetical protein
MAEAMFLGKPVIATGYSGNMDFMTKANSYLIDYRMIEVGVRQYAYDCAASWASPHVDHAGALMRHVFENPAEAAARGRKAQADITTKHSTAAVAAKILDRLAVIGMSNGGENKP